MPDITMCLGYKGALREQLCPMRNGCHRFTAQPSDYRQSYFTEAPFVVGEHGHYYECGHRWPTSDFERATKGRSSLTLELVDLADKWDSLALKKSNYVPGRHFDPTTIILAGCAADLRNVIDKHKE